MYHMKAPETVRWVHTPRYVTRRNLVLHLLNRLPRGSFIDIGCGRGELLPRLAELGFWGTGLDISPAVAPVAREIVKPYSSRVRFVSDPAELDGQKYEYLIAMEILEHLEDDEAALRQWCQWLSDDGRVIITVPAHMRYWSASDEAVGHVRRYERAQLVELIEKSGLTVEVLWSSGFPLRLVMTPLARFRYWRKRRASSPDVRDRTFESSFESTLGIKRGRNLAASVIEVVGRIAHVSQLVFRERDFGDGYLALCRRVQQ